MVSKILNGDGPFVITSHVNPDGDAVGSVLAVYSILAEQGKDVKIAWPSPVPQNLKWISDKVTLGQDSVAKLSDIAKAGVVIVLDLNSLSRLDEIGVAIKNSKATIVNIDHHTEPEDFAHVQLIDTEAPATCAMLFDLLGPTFSREAATCLYIGLMTDTGSFRFPRTTAHVMHMAGQLIECGADPVECYERVYNTNSRERTQLLGAALAGMQFFHDGALCVMTVRSADIQKYHANVEDTEGFVHHTLSIEGVKMGVLLVELSGMTKCSFRSKGDVYIRDLAASYGGGGHVYAAGARMKGVGIDDAISRIVTDSKSLV